MAAFTPSKPDFFDGTWRGKIRVWTAPTGASGDTLTVSGIKRVFSVTVGSRPTLSWTSSSAGNGNGVVVTLTITASCTGANTPITVYGQ
jgi:hypothetical protein